MSRKFRIVLEEVKDNGISEEQCHTFRNVLSDLMSDDGIKLQLAWANAMLDAKLTRSSKNDNEFIIFKESKRGYYTEVKKALNKRNNTKR